MIELKNIHKYFLQSNNSVSIFNNANLQINRGELIAIKGRSGSGKSTLLNILSGLDVDYLGDYCFMGETLKKNISLMADYRLKNIGIVTQDCQLLENRTCYENIAFPLRCLKLDHKNIIKRVEEVMEILDVSQYRNEYPYKLSGGQCQRIAIARAAVKTPKVFIADEPTGALDLKAEQEVLKALKTIISKECTVIIATHSDGVAKWCDRSVVIKDFKID